MKKHAYANTRTDDLWNAVEAAGAKGLVSIAHDFTKQPGVPLIVVEGATCQNGITRLSLSQGEFSRDRKAVTDKKPLRWNVPVIARTVGGKTVTTIVSGGKTSLMVPGCRTVVVNAGQSGYYRVQYQPDMLAALRKDFAKLPAIDQLGLLNDSQSLAYNDYQPIRPTLELLDVIPADASQKVMEDAVAAIADMYARFDKEPARQAQIAQLATKRFGPVLVRLGMKQRKDDSTLDANLRSALIGSLGYMGDAKVVAEARRLFAELDRNPAALDGPLRQTWLGVVAQNADRASWDKLRTLGQAAESQLVKSTMYRLLGGARDTALAQATLDLALTDEPGATLSAAMIGGVAGDHPDLAVDFALANREAVEALVDVSSRSEFIPQLGIGSSDPAMVGKLQSYAKDHLKPESRKPVDQAVASITTRVKASPRIKAGIAEWLDSARGS